MTKWSLSQRHQRGQGGLSVQRELTSGLVPEIERGALIGLAADVTHPLKGYPSTQAGLGWGGLRGDNAVGRGRADDQ
jgi:hypothetical protein